MAIFSEMSQIYFKFHSFTQRTILNNRACFIDDIVTRKFYLVATCTDITKFVQNSFGAIKRLIFFGSNKAHIRRCFTLSALTKSFRLNVTLI